MSERERWIIYPLLFFALGAGIRDKILQRVEVKEIVCESLKVVDLQDPLKPLAVLDFRRKDSKYPSQLADRVGQLRLVDSNGREFCDMTNDVILDRLFVHQMVAVDPLGKPVVRVGNEPVAGTTMRIGDTVVPAFQGVIVLNNRHLGTGMRLAPPASRPQVPAARPQKTEVENPGDSS